MVDIQKTWKVYKHTTPNNKVYIGITSQSNPNIRWRNGNGYKHNPHFNNAINKYGWENIKHEILYDNLEEKEAKELEIRMIELHKACNPQYGYNISRGGDGVTGVQRFGESNSFYGKKHTDETRRKMRMNHNDSTGENNSFFGKHHSDDTRIIISQKARERYSSSGMWIGHPVSEEQKNRIGKQHSKPILQYDLNMNFIQEYDNLLSLEKLGFRRASVRDVCLGRKENYCNYIWRYKYDEDKWTEGYIIGTKSDNIYCLDKDLNFVGCYKSYLEASKCTNVGRRIISASCKNEKHFGLGFYWLHKEDYKKYIEGSLTLKGGN